MKRIPEPPLMLDADQAKAYAEADFAEPHQACVDLFHERFAQRPTSGRLLDLGCGPGDITLNLARSNPGYEVDGVDGSAAMLGIAQTRLQQEPSLLTRVRFIEGFIPGVTLPSETYDIVFTNSFLHHLEDPQVLWQTLREATRPGSLVFVHDLFRPPDPKTAQNLVEQYSRDEPEVLKRDFFNSLLAAFEPEEVRNQLRVAGLDCLEVSTVSDRHMAITGQIPG